MKEWIKKKNRKLMNAGIQYWMLYVVLPVGFFFVACAIIFLMLDLNYNIYAIVLSYSQQIIYVSIMNLLMFFRNILDILDNKEVLENNDTWIAGIIVVVDLLVFATLTVRIMQGTQYTYCYVICVSIVAIILLYISLLIHSEYCKDSKSIGDYPTLMSNNRAAREQEEDSLMREKI